MVTGSRFGRVDLSRRQVLGALPALLLADAALGGCTASAGTDAVAAAAGLARRTGPASGRKDAELGRELVRYASLAPSSHNTQCWIFALEDRAVTLRVDPSRRCPAVDPDDHHMYVSLGCASENLILAAAAHGLHAELRSDSATDGIRVTLAERAPEASPLFRAIPERQCTRGDYDGRPLSGNDLALMRGAGQSEQVDLLLLTGQHDMERVLDHVVHANTLQMGDDAFVQELRSWIRFNGAAAIRSGDGLFSGCTGNPSIPTWLGELAFPVLFTTKGENNKYARQIRSSAGIAVFAARSPTRESWIEVGRCYQRFALQATVLGIRTAFLNAPVEVAAARSSFASDVGLTGRRPDLVVRFGRGPRMPDSLRRPVSAVLS